MDFFSFEFGTIFIDDELFFFEKEKNFLIANMKFIEFPFPRIFHKHTRTKNWFI